MSEFPDTRSTLLAQVRSPDNGEAWEQFVALYRPVIYRMARKRGMQDSDAQDLAQTVLMRVAGAIDRWERADDPNIGFRNWLARVAKNAIITTLTTSARDAAAGSTDIQELLGKHPDIPTDVEREITLEHLREQYHRAAAIVQTDVNAETWRAFELSVIDGKPCDEVAAIVGKPIGTVYAARSRVMRRLRDQVQRLDGDER